MPALWPVMAANLKLKLPTATDVSSLAEIYATEYTNATQNASIVLTSALPTSSPKTAGIKAGFILTFNILFNIKKELKPNYKDDKISAEEKKNQDDARSVIEAAFLPAATAIVAEWILAVFNPSVTPPSYVSPTTGYTILFPGKPDDLAKDLAKAFYVAQTESNADKAFELHLTELISAYSKHLLTVSGFYNGLISSPTGPVPGPPFPFVGIV